MRKTSGGNLQIGNIGARPIAEVLRLPGPPMGNPQTDPVRVWISFFAVMDGRVAGLGLLAARIRETLLVQACRFMPLA